MRRLGGKAEEARALAYLLYAESNKRGWQEEARGYNDLVVSWSGIQGQVAVSGDLETGGDVLIEFGRQSAS